jgi:hypothetical protein
MTPSTAAHPCGGGIALSSLDTGVSPAVLRRPYWRRSKNKCMAMMPAILWVQTAGIYVAKQI